MSHLVQIAHRGYYSVRVCKELAVCATFVDIGILDEVEVVEVWKDTQGQYWAVLA